MTSRGADARRRAAAHVVVDDIDVPSLDDATVHHLARVVRLRDGDVVTLTDGRGAWRTAVWERGEIALDGPVEREPPRTHRITIGFAIPKRDRPEWIVQKLTELGVDRIVLVHAQRSVVRWDAPRAERHTAKLRTVARDALRQSRGVWLPAIDGPVAATDALAGAAAAEPGGCALTAEQRSLVVGPEGGWTDDELARAVCSVDLGETVLRVETAALSAAARMVALRGA